MSVQDGYIPVDGGNVYYQAFGLDKKNTPLVVVHGGPGVPHNYLLGLQKLADERPVIFYDQLGCGQSDPIQKVEGIDPNRFIIELHQVVTHLELEKYYLLGQSWGSYVVASYLHHYQPEGVQKVVFSAPYFSTALWQNDVAHLIAQLPPETQKTISDHESSGVFNSQAYQEAMMVFYQKHVCNLDPWPENLMDSFDQINTDLYEYMWGPSEFTINGLLQDADLTPSLRDLPFESLITVGEFDEVSIETARHYENLLPNARLVIFSGNTHSHHIESEEKYLQTLRDFLK